MPDTKGRTVFIVSDSTGETAGRALSVALEQFPGVKVNRQVLADVSTPAEIAQAVHAVAESNGFLLFTFASEYLRQTAHTAAKEKGVLAVDLLDILLRRLEDWLQVDAIQVPGHAYDPMYFERLKAHDFATKQDDGKNPSGLLEADVVVIGLSRSGKSPVCHMLADHRVCAANVPVVRVDALPRELFEVDPARVYALRVEPRRLVEVRMSRAEREGMGSTDYTDLRAVREEVRLYDTLLARQERWTSIDATRQGVEEAARSIRLSHLERFPDARK